MLNESYCISGPGFDIFEFAYFRAINRLKMVLLFSPIQQ